MREFPLQIVTPDRPVFDGMAEAILVRTDGGDVEIMAAHEDYFATLGIGRAKLVVKGEAREASASGGFISVLGGKVKLVCTTFEFADEIDLSRAVRAKERAEEAIRVASDKREFALSEAKLKRAINRINVAKNK